MAIKEKDFVVLSYTGKLADGMVFDTTDKEIAQQSGLNAQSVDGPVTVCVGQKQVLEGLDKALIGAMPGKHTIHLSAEHAFGKKSTQLIQLVPTAKFKQQKINPQPGLQVNIDNQMGIIKRVSGGRTLVDFNHPLSGQDVSYDIEIQKVIEDPEQKLQGLMKVLMGPTVSAEVKENKAVVTTHMELPEQAKAHLITKINELIPEIKTIDWNVAKQEEKKV